MPGYCSCPLIDNCRCGEEQNAFEWNWVKTTEQVTNTHFDADDREATFHRLYSTGTAVIKGTKEFVADYHYYWEIKILSVLYGTDVMIGIGTPDVEYGNSIFKFSSFLGQDSESYGISYTGRKQHDGKTSYYCNGYSQGDIIGVYLDTWKGTIEFYINRKPMGIAFRGLKRHKKLYPMVCSTASHSIVKLTYTMSCPTSLVFNCARTLGQLSNAKNLLKNIPAYNFFFKKAFWILLPTLDAEKELVYNDNIHHYQCSRSSKRFQSCHSLFPRGKRYTKFVLEQYCQGQCKNVAAGKIDDETIIKPSADPANLVSSSSRDVAMNTDNDKSNDAVWLAALEPTDKPSNDDCSETINRNFIRFASNLNPSSVCNNCNTNVGVVISQSTQSKSCLDCFYSENN